jgi:hypothetical protein
VLVSCAPELEKLDDVRSARGSLGEEVYKTLCRRVAGTAMPDDLDGRRSEALCLGNAAQAEGALDEGRDQLPARLVALAERRARLVAAVDAMLPGDLGDELEDLTRQLLPFYEVEEGERIQESTRTLSAFMQALAGDDAARLGLERLGRAGMSPPEHSFGAYRALLGYERVAEVLAVLLPILTESEAVRPYFETVLSGIALELATSEVDDAPDASTRLLKDLLTRTHPDFAVGDALYTAVRDARGLPTPRRLGGDVPYPFVDKDGDGLADESGGKFVLAPSFTGELPAPFATRDESTATRRDDQGRALGFESDGTPSERQLYDTVDANQTVLAAVMRESGKLFEPESQIAIKLAKVVPALFGERIDQQREYAKARLAYRAPDTDDSPAVDLVHALGTLVDRDVYPDTLRLSAELLDKHEAAWARALAPLLALEKRTRKDSDAYPGAKLADETTFWDELLYEVEKLSRQRRDAQGATAVENMMRASLGYARSLEKTGAPLERIADYAALKHTGAVAAVLMRYKDEWRSNPNTESDREPGEPAIIGSFKTPVDRTKPDTPVTCGADGCGGLIKGTPFERWTKRDEVDPNKILQLCMVQREGRNLNNPNPDCGAPANQSLYHRSLGLIAEMAGRGQCNKTITIGDLLDFAVLEDPCRNPDDEVSCVGADAAAKDAFCVTDRGADWECDDTRDLCIIKANTLSCNEAKQSQQQERQSTIGQARTAVLEDYSCSHSATAYDACLEQPNAAAFLDPDWTPTANGPADAGIQECHLMDLPDVGRTFGRALTHEFTIEVPNPWVYRYLEDVARARDTTLPTCAVGDVADPTELPRNALNQLCVPNAARLSRDVYAEDLVEYESRYAVEVDTLGELIEFLLDDRSLFPSPEDTAELRPDVKALSRVLFAPSGSSSTLLFDPLLIKGAPAACTPALIDAGTPFCAGKDGLFADCCISNIKKPPVQYRLDTYYGATTFSWEQPLQFTDGTSLSFIDSMVTLADAINAVDYAPERGDDAADFESTAYAFSTVGNVVALHYDSPESGAGQDPNKPYFRYLSNMVSYEEMIADLLDDGTIVDDDVIDLAGFTAPEQQLGLLYESFELLEVLDRMDFSGGRDGIDVGAELAEQLMNPHARCAGTNGDRRVLEQKGACDKHAAGTSGLEPPVSYRDGRNSICWNDGRCFDGADLPKRYASPVYLVLDAISDIDGRIAADPEVDATFDQLRGLVIDTFASIENDALKDRLARALLIVGSEYMLDRIEAERAAGTLATLPAELTEDAIDLIASPVFAGGLDMLEALLDEPVALEEMTRFAFALLDGGAENQALRGLLAAAADLVQTLPGDENTNALLRALAQSLVPNAQSLVAGGGDDIALDQGFMWQNLTLSRDTVALDDAGTMQKVLNNLVRSAQGTPYMPLETFVDAILAINRDDPSETGVLSAQDWSSVLTQVADVMLDERRGLERLYTLVQCRDADAEDPVCE